MKIYAINELPEAKFPYNVKVGDLLVVDVSRFHYPYRFGYEALVEVVVSWSDGLLMVKDVKKGEYFKLRSEEVIRRAEGGLIPKLHE